MSNQQRLEMKIGDVILEVAEMALDETWSDVQGIAMVKAREIIALVEKS